MTPEDWTDVANYTLLALGVAMAGGTGLALATYHRTGLFPGQPVDDDGQPVGTPSIRSAWIKIAVGVVVLLWGLAGLATNSIFGL